MKNFSNYVVFTFFLNSILVVSSSILNITADNFETYRDVMVELLTKCHPNYHNVIFFDDRHENDYLSSIISSSTYIRINSSTKYNFDQIEKIQKTTIIDAVIMTLYTAQYLREFIMTLKSVQLLNIETPIYIFSRRQSSCLNRKIILEIIWSLELLSVFFVCVAYIHPDKLTLVYTFNPYASYAPRQWFLLTKFIEPNNPFRLFNRVYKKGNLCQGLDFDRTRYINNAIKMKLGIELDPATQTINEKLEWNHFSHESLADEFYYDKIILKLLKTSMNIGYQATFINYRTIKKRGYNEIFRDANNLKIDLILFHDEIVSYQNFAMSYPFKIIEYKIVALERDYQNLFEYIYDILGFPMFIMMIILIVLTFLVVWLSNRKKSIAFAGFEVIRLLIDASLEIKMNTASLKIFFMIIFFYFLFIQTLFQGELARFFTNRPHHKFPDSIEKLIRLRYKRIYYPRSILHYMKQFKTPNTKHAQLPAAITCPDFLFSNELSACIIENKWAHILAMYFFKISPVAHKSYQFYVTRNNSPLKNRINKSFLQLWELGFASLISNLDNNVHMGFITTRAIQRSSRWSRIKNRNLLMMYKFLVIGLSLATVSFFFELIIHNRKKIKESILKNRKISITKLNVVRIIRNIIMIRQPLNREEEEKYRL